MKYLPDSNLWIALLRRNSDRRQAAARWLDLRPSEEMGMSSVVAAELIVGALKSQRPAENLRRVEQLLAQYAPVEFGMADARHAGEIRAQLEAAGTKIGPYDLQIAATARARGLIVATANIREFGRVPNLQVENWEGP